MKAGVSCYILKVALDCDAEGCFSQLIGPVVEGVATMGVNLTEVDLDLLAEVVELFFVGLRDWLIGTPLAGGPGFDALVVVADGDARIAVEQGPFDSSQTGQAFTGNLMGFQEDVTVS